MAPAKNKFGFRGKQQKESSAKISTVFPQRKKSNTTPDPKATKKPATKKPATIKRKTVISRVSGSVSGSKRQRWVERGDVNIQEGGEENPIIIDDNFRIKVEPELEIKEEEEEVGGITAPRTAAAGRVVLPTAPYIPALRNPGKPRGFASMTKEELEGHDFRDSHGARERNKALRPNPYSRGYPIIRSRATAPDMDYSEDREVIEVDDESWIEQDEHDYRWVEDDVNDAETPPSSEPSIPIAPSPVSPHRIQLFQDTFGRLVFLGSDTVNGITYAINMWLSHTMNFHIDEAKAAFEDLEGQGKIRVHAGRVYRPEAYEELDEILQRQEQEVETAA